MDHHNIETYTSSATGQWLRPGQYDRKVQGLAEDVRPFDKFVHEQEIHVPIPVFSHSADDVYHRCLDMPLRLPGQLEYALPLEWVGLADLVQQIIDVEHAHNPHWQDYFTYLSVDSSFVLAGQVQRNPGLHTDGFQGARQPERTKGSRGYVLTSNGGSLYYPQTFKVGCDESIFNIFEGFDLQAGKPESTTEGMVSFLSCYAVHAAGAAARDGHRLFVRVVWEMKRFDRSTNTRNAMLDYQWPALVGDVRDGLKTPTLADLG